MKGASYIYIHVSFNCYLPCRPRDRSWLEAKPFETIMFQQYHFLSSEYFSLFFLYISFFIFLFLFSIPRNTYHCNLIAKERERDTSIISFLFNETLGFLNLFRDNYLKRNVI